MKVGNTNTIDIFSSNMRRLASEDEVIPLRAEVGGDLAANKHESEAITILCIYKH